MCMFWRVGAIGSKRRRVEKVAGIGLLMALVATVVCTLFCEQ